MIELRGLSKEFSGKLAIDNLTLKVQKGEVFALLGPNGAGKTTTVKLLCCLLRPSAGDAIIDGLSIRKPENQEKIRKIVGLLPETPGLYDSLTAHENLRFYARMHGIDDAVTNKRIRNLLDLLDLRVTKKERAATFSKGMKQKVAIARALIHDPKVVFLDEPTAGLDPKSAKTVREMIKHLKDRGRTVFINTHNLDEVARTCDHVAIIKNRLIASGSPDDIGGRGRKRKFYCGFKTPVHVSEVLTKLPAMPFLLSTVPEGKRGIIFEIDSYRQNSPLLLRSLVNAGFDVETFSEQSRGLEDIYISIIGEGTSR